MPADRRDLERRLAAATDADTSRGLNFNRLFDLVREKLGDDAARACDPQRKGSRTDFFSWKKRRAQRKRINRFKMSSKPFRISCRRRNARPRATAQGEAGRGIPFSYCAIPSYSRRRGSPTSGPVTTRT